MNKLKTLYYSLSTSLLLSTNALASAHSAADQGALTTWIAGWSGTLTQVAIIGAYVGGALFLLVGFFKIKAHAEDSRQTPFSQVAGAIGAGLGLLVFGFIVSSVGTSKTAQQGANDVSIQVPVISTTNTSN
jgi:hypothetical protein